MTDKELLKVSNQENTNLRSQVTELLAKLELIKTDQKEPKDEHCSLSNVIRIKKFLKGDNFNHFCDRFIEYVTMTGLSDDNLYLVFLQQLDDETYAKLKEVSLNPVEKKDVEKFCTKYKTMYHGKASMPLQFKVFDCKQHENESVSDFAMRLREKASIAYSDKHKVADVCHTAFIRGVINPKIRRRLYETCPDNFNGAVEKATKFEAVETMMIEESSSSNSNVTSILKQDQFRPRSSDDLSDDSDTESGKSIRHGSKNRFRNDSRDNSRNRYRNGSRDNSRNRYGNGSRDISRRNNIECYNCGHIERFCRNRLQNYNRLNSYQSDREGDNQDDSWDRLN